LQPTRLRLVATARRDCHVRVVVGVSECRAPIVVYTTGVRLWAVRT
jgi:hypothetical protein